VTERSQMTVSLTNEAIDILEKHTTPRKRGEFISNLIVAYGSEAGAITQVDVETIKLQMLGMASTSKTLDGRLTKVERQLAAMIADHSK
jgi:hypothetical protein